MPKTYYLGKNKAGQIVARASGSDYGYTHAAVRVPLYRPGRVTEHAGNQILPNNDVTFSTSAQGAARNAVQWRTADGHELVALEKVDAKTYKAATGKS